jgi:hypothetical protein
VGAIPAPEFGIFGSAEYINRANQVNDLLYHDSQPWALQPPIRGWGPRDYVPNPPRHVDAHVGGVCRHRLRYERAGRARQPDPPPRRDEASTRRTIVNAVDRIDQADRVRRAKLAVNLVLISLDYLVQK